MNANDYVKSIETAIEKEHDPWRREKMRNILASALEVMELLKTNPCIDPNELHSEAEAEG